MFENQPLFSVIVPAYNAEKYLEECLNSIIRQTYKNIEIIVVDDGSSDRTGSICDEYAATDKRIKVIHQKNGGVVRARESAANIVTGQYIINVDADDWISNNFCEMMASIILDSKPQIILCGHINVWEDRTVECPLPYSKGFYSRERIEKEIIPVLLQTETGKSFSLSLWAKAIDRNLQKKYQLKSVDMNIGEDICCIAPSIYHAHSLYIMDENMYFYRQNSSSITKGRKTFNWEGPELRGKHLEKSLFPYAGDIQDQIARYVTHSVFNVAKSQFNRNDASKTEIEKDIVKHLKMDYYNKAIQKSHFKGTKAVLMRLCLKYRMTVLLAFLNKVKI